MIMPELNAGGKVSAEHKVACLSTLSPIWSLEIKKLKSL
jgi:hypothetical protein